MGAQKASDGHIVIFLCSLFHFAAVAERAPCACVSRVHQPAGQRTCPWTAATAGGTGNNSLLGPPTVRGAAVVGGVAAALP